ncbi:Membrane steroid-binding protein 1 [Yarrowia sp. B02]|nr:Membrane steroid-binding protein 1 [Yarrowia sp. B02]
MSRRRAPVRSDRIEELDDDEIITHVQTNVPASTSTKKAPKAQIKTDNESSSLFDILRSLFFLVFLGVTLSYYITGTWSWGYETQLTNPAYLRHTFKHNILREPYLTLTDEQLQVYDGTKPGEPIYVGVGGKVYDVSANPLTYGPGGPYHFFAGRDAARAFSTGCFQTDLTWDIRGLDPETVAKDIRGWQKFFEKNNKYFYVGKVVHPEPTGEPPKFCQGQKMPGGRH